MITENLFFIDVIELMPNNSRCYIQAPNLSSSKLLDTLEETQYPYYKSIELNKHNNALIIDCILSDEIIEDIQSVEIRYNDKLLFEGYDGLEYGTISKEILLPENFKRKYIDEDMCIVSNEW